MENIWDAYDDSVLSFDSDKSSSCFKGDKNQPMSEASTISLRADTENKVHRSQAHLDTDACSAGFGDGLSSKLARINGAINRMTKEQLQRKLAGFHLNTSGVKDVLKKRLKNYYKHQRMAQRNKVLSENERTQYDYLVVIDFEATCSETNENFVHEIIEFPAVLVDVQNQVLCDVFQSYCKPKVNPTLTEFCTTLTGISQTQVDQAKDFTAVFEEFQDWLSLHKLGTEHKFAVLTDGPWDMARFLKTQVKLSDIPYPRWAKQWINLRKSYTAFYECQRVNLHQMLEDLGMEFQGRPHCGLDDARNIAAIVVRLLQDGCIMRVNEYYHEGDISPRKTGSSRGSRYANTQRSSHNASVQKKKSENSKSERLAAVPQEGENIEDLLQYLKIQKSRLL